MSEFIEKMRPRHTVLKRTRPRTDLPKLLLYMDMPTTAKRRLLDSEGEEHELADNIVESSYRLVTGAQAKTLIEEHWPKVAKENEARHKRN